MNLLHYSSFSNSHNFPSKTKPIPRPFRVTHPPA